MAVAEAYGDLLRMGTPVVTTAEAAARMNRPVRTAYKRLKTMEKAGLVTHVKQGLWLLDPELPRYALAPYLTAPLPAYVSVTSALAHHGMIEQIPRQVSVVSLDRSRRISTSFGLYVVHQISPGLFGGFEGTNRSGYMARPGKALFDAVYLGAAGGTVTFFPELTLPGGFERSECLAWIEKIGSTRLKSMVSRRLGEVLDRAS